MSDPIEEKHRSTMNQIAKTLDKIFNGEDKGKNRKVGFTLFVYELETGPKEGQMNYISNADRHDFCLSLKEMIAQLEGRYHKSETEQ